MSFCYPAETDWSVKFTAEQLAEMRADETKAKAMERAEAFAWSTLAVLTGYQVGVCPILIRPCSARGLGAGSWMEAPVLSSTLAGVGQVAIGTFSPYISGGQWYNACGCGGGCSCDRVSEVLLPGPVGSIERVVVSGEIIDPSRYRVDDGFRLVSTDPELRWPLTQDLTAGPDDIGAFSVSFYQGAAPNDMTRLAAGALAAEFYGGMIPGGKCTLPAGVRTITRSGTTYDVKASLFEGGFTGIILVDAVIRMLNPNGLKSPVAVTSPDVNMGGRRQTWGNW